MYVSSAQNWHETNVQISNAGNESEQKRKGHTQGHHLKTKRNKDIHVFCIDYHMHNEQF